MQYDARQIANWFLSRAKRDGQCPSIMALLKLTYIAHGWNLEINNAPLFPNRIEAWQYGPVIPDVYNSFRPQGVTPFKPDSNYPDTIDDPTTENLLEQIYNIYGTMTPFRLSEITHEPGGPWETATRLGGWYAPIPNELIQSHYIVKRRQANAQK
ncbi:Panacea domain-containing protein [Rhodobium gokarnense]|uniref:Phage-associated protein n=1 Tax=Rhodobium gokarnense TaxID=364296 RepID=A0ABT3HEI4_9HYPH|nr:type II toxin-antitoxin system antitoxin SocA domain-containing protein [Rhodobium gokarnense]MCW2308811.1 putative phage-associated protein [Rhodobium gokarnense]